MIIFETYTGKKLLESPTHLILSPRIHKRYIYKFQILLYASLLVWYLEVYGLDSYKNKVLLRPTEDEI